MVKGTPGERAVCGIGDVAVDSMAWRFKGQLNLTVIAKATFAFAFDADMPRIAPEPVLQDDVYGKIPGRSARFSSDRAPYLGSADVMFTGHACSPSGPVRSMQVRFGVYRGRTALLDKALLVRADKPFERMPMVYERAYGGSPACHENPFGVGANPDSGTPNILDLRDPERVGGYGPIARIWPLRRRLLGSTPKSVLAAPIAELHDDLDWAYFQAAPADQQLNFLHGDEWILLSGLHPTHASVRMRLPNARALARVHGLEGQGVPDGQGLVLVADTLHVDGAELRCTVVWRRSFPLAGEAALDSVRVQAGVESLGQPIDWPAPPPARGPRLAAAGGKSHPLSRSLVAVDEDELSVSTIDIIDDEDEEREPLTIRKASNVSTLELLPDDVPAQKAPLPFQTGPSLLHHPPPAPRPRRNPAFSSTVTLDPDADEYPATLSALPFAHAAPAPSPAAAPEGLPGFRDVAAARPVPAAAPAPADAASWGWREEPAAREVPVPAPPKVAKATPKMDVQSVLYGGKKKRK